MEINVMSYDHVDVVVVSGRIDGSNANELDTAFKELQANERFKLVTDLSEIGYMNSAGLRALVAARIENKAHKGDLFIANPSERMVEVLSLVGFNTIFQTFPDQTAAVAAYVT
jgi:anti-sigma B factor antagonist